MNSVYERLDVARVQFFTGLEIMGDYISLLRCKICRAVQSTEVNSMINSANIIQSSEY